MIYIGWAHFCAHAGTIYALLRVGTKNVPTLHDCAQDI